MMSTINCALDHVPERGRILSENLADCFGFNKGVLMDWSLGSSSGCLGEELKLVLERTCSADHDHVGPLSIARVDELLDELASTSGYTDSSIRSKYKTIRRAPLSIIKDLFRTLSPIEAGFLTQIVLKDLRPILYPLTEMHPVAALLHHNQASTKMLSKEDAMNIWDPTKQMSRAYRVNSTLLNGAQSLDPLSTTESSLAPQIGLPVQIPKSEKGTSPRHALHYFPLSQKVWAETKYDGERAQIHVQVRNTGPPRIKIFSKSKRDSTWDRKAVHDSIYRALGLSGHVKKGGAVSGVQENVILDAEMVAFHGDKIDGIIAVKLLAGDDINDPPLEFWRIRSLIERTAVGIRGRRQPAYKNLSAPETASQSSTSTDYSDRHLGLVFFDILFLDSKSHLSTPYWRRRQILENLIQTTPGECILSARVAVGPDANTNTKNNNALEKRQVALERIFAHIIASSEEGIVLKGHESRYHDFSTPWVKLKKDYIPGYGDTLDLVIVAAGWDKERARQLRVPPSTLTTFYIGGQEKKGLTGRQSPQRPHFHVYFTVSFGLSRVQLEQANFHIRSSSIPYSPQLNTNALEYTFSLLPSLPPPDLLLNIPLLGEVFGAGFTKSYKSRHYEIRFPRLTKLYRPSERGWEEAISLEDLHGVACSALGRDDSTRSAKNINDEIWRGGGKHDHSETTSVTKRKATEDFWERKLAALDGGLGGGRGGMRKTLLQLHVTIPVEPMRSVMKRPRTEIMLAKGVATTPILTPFAPHQTSVLGSEPCLSPPSRSCELPASGDDKLKSRETSTPHFLTNALIWSARPRRSSTVWAVESTLSQAQRLHSVESLMAGCGWYPDIASSSWAERGVAFIDESDDAGKAVARRVLSTLRERLATLPPGHLRKAIWVFDQRSWASGGLIGGSIEHRVLCRLE